MTKHDIPNSGVLFKNDRKQNERSPDYRGSINIDGREMWLNAWIKTSAAGNKFMSLSVKPKDATANPAPARRDDLNDPLPF